jgi:hypothetical protein
MSASRFLKFIMMLSFAVLLILTAVEIRSVFAQSLDCGGSAKAYKMQGIPCDCENGRIVCKKSSGGSASYGSSGSKSKKKGLSSKNTMKLQMLQGAMDGFANSFIKWMNSPSTGPTPDEIAAAQERAKAEWQAKVQKQIGEMESQQKETERQKTSESKNRLLAGMKGMDKANPDRQSAAMQQLQIVSCKAYWEKRAVEATAANDEKNADLYSQYAKNPGAAAMAECAKAMPQPPEPPTPDEFRAELFETVIDELNLRFPMLEQAKQNQEEIAGRFNEIQKKVDELKTKNMQAATPVEKKESYDLMIAALKELENATAQKKEADAGIIKLEMEISALNEVGRMANAVK